MSATYRRHGIVIALALLAGIASLAIRPQEHAVALPSLAGLTAGTGWHVAGAYAPNGLQTTYAYQEWQLRSTHGEQALLYLAATSAVQKMLHWTGELGYEGEGYQVLSHRTTRVPLSDGTTALVSVVAVQHLADRELLAYAVVSRDGIAARSSDDVLRTAWDALRGSDETYYLVRVSIAQPASDEAGTALATRLLAPVLSALRAEARAAAL